MSLIFNLQTTKFHCVTREYKQSKKTYISGRLLLLKNEDRKLHQYITNTWNCFQWDADTLQLFEEFGSKMR